ncbi:heparinase II/III domain-containing protein [Pedobacter mucosus]|uniref:heparinase II/III domain-containing protein n=1 Tax=Pedobacter mucosus TaxID=2895286 RepID=UPI001EE3DAF8|nr:heparinase II/III family protein [Pedobacter mucosus]UKT64947.1 heparinase II/III-family protein [Pedobacter mucosus]
MYKKLKILLTCLFLFALVLQTKAQTDPYALLTLAPVDLSRVKEIEAMLPNQPKGIGDPIEMRARWDSLYRTNKFKKLISEADSISVSPFPKLTPAIYMSYFGGKDSETSKRFIMKRRMLLTKLVWAECLINKGKYMPAILTALTDILNTPTWTFPAEDQKKLNYDGKLYTIGLSSSAYGSDIAESYYLLKSKFSAQMRQQILTLLHQRIFEPTLNAIKNKNANGEFTSLMDTGNHNSVTLAYVTMAALAVIENKEQRAVFVAIGERYSKNFLRGYLEDGYCTEGVGYYSYGFGHYTFLRDALWQATKGKIDLFSDPKVSKMAMFAPKAEIINNMFPAIGDCVQYAKPEGQLMHYLNKNLGLGLAAYNDAPSYMEQPALCYLMYYFPNAATAAKLNEIEKEGTIRDYFEKAGVLTVRPIKGSSFNFGATLKGGHNAEHHNHNDVGSYTIFVGTELLTGDVGLATYTPKYFGKERYDLYKTTASYGHNVPLVNGIQQHFGKDARAVVSKTSFTNNKDVFELDITSAYKDPSLKQLIRTFTYDRSAKGYLMVTDRFSFNTASTFETTIITRYGWKKTSDNTIEINGEKEKLKVTITSSKSSFTISDEVIDEGPKPFTRIAIKLNDKSSAGFVTMKFDKL